MSGNDFPASNVGWDDIKQSVSVTAGGLSGVKGPRGLITSHMFTYTTDRWSDHSIIIFLQYFCPPTDASSKE